MVRTNFCEKINANIFFLCKKSVPTSIMSVSARILFFKGDKGLKRDNLYLIIRWP